MDGFSSNDGKQLAAILVDDVNTRAGKPSCIIVNWDNGGNRCILTGQGKIRSRFLTFPGHRIRNILSKHTNWGFLPTFITGKFALFL